MKLYPNVSSIFIIWVLAILAIFFFGFSNFPHSGKFSNNFWDNLGNWDGGHYLGIAKAGYSEKFQYAFFPLYPLATAAVNQITQNYLMAAILISFLSVFLGMHLLYKLIALDYDKKIAEKTVFLLLIFPTSFYFLTAYSEGLFFLLCLTALFFLRKGNLKLAVLAAVLASATRLAGLALVLGLILEVWITRGINKTNWYIFLAPLGFIIYCWYLFNTTGDLFYFMTAQLNWQRSLVLPVIGFWEALKSLSTPGFITQNFNVFLDLIFAVFGVGMIIRSFRFLPISYGIYGLISLLLPLFTPQLSSMPRFLLPVFPIFILLALVKNQRIILAYQIISLMLLSAYSILFINGYWVS